MGRRGKKRISQNNNEGDDASDAMTKDGDRPQKRFYRSRAHANPLSHNSAFIYPSCPEKAPWTNLYPDVIDPTARILDIGCGFGGLTVALAKEFPLKCILAMEIRDKVAEFVRLRIESLRQEFPGEYKNAAVLRANTMIYLPNFIRKGQLDKIFICFPDPHFKAKKHRRRIISESLLTEYAFFLKEGGILYVITDVEKLHEWHVEKCESHPGFESLTQDEMNADPCLKLMQDETEEGKKVSRAGASKYWSIYRRKRDIDVEFTIF